MGHIDLENCNAKLTALRGPMRNPNKPINRYCLLLFIASFLMTPTMAPAQTLDVRPGVDADGQALTEMVHRIQSRWKIACDTKGFRDTHPDIRFVIGKGGNIVSGPDWINPDASPVWISAAELAKSTVMRGQPYDSLPPELYNTPIVITFDARSACK